jgi:hypothetical protein
MWGPERKSPCPSPSLTNAGTHMTNTRQNSVWAPIGSWTADWYPVGSWTADKSIP